LEEVFLDGTLVAGLGFVVLEAFGERIAVVENSEWNAAWASSET